MRCACIKLCCLSILVAGQDVLFDSTASGFAPPRPVENLVAADHPWDAGDHLDLQWDLSPDDSTVSAYQVFRALGSVGGVSISPEFTVVDVVARGTRTVVVPDLQPSIDRWDLAKHYSDVLDVPALVGDGAQENFELGYVFQVIAIGESGERSEPQQTTSPVVPTMQAFDSGRLWLLIITLTVCGAVIAFILLARSGLRMRVRKIAGLEAVDEAVGRATEMGRPVLFVTGTQDMNDIQTIAGLTILARVAKTAAEYDAKVEVPTSRSLVMTAARDTVHSAFIAAGRGDAFNPDMIYYVTDEQFGFVAHLQGTMVRQKPATCFYMGHFFAESLILAETGNSIGAIQVAGTAAPAQLPFFVAACDYTLIGEEFFAASAYLSGEPDQLGSLKGQDVGKIIVAAFILVGCAVATMAALNDSQSWRDVLEFIRGTMLT